MKPITQTTFGAPDAEIVGNCYPACIASLLEISLDEVPHVFQLHRDPEAALDATLAFLRERGCTTLTFDWAPWLNRYAVGALAIFSGKSPRGDWSHAVVGEITETGWRLLHDPHPSRDGIVGDATHCELIIPLMKAAA